MNGRSYPAVHPHSSVFLAHPVRKGTRMFQGEASLQAGPWGPWAFREAVRAADRTLELSTPKPSVGTSRLGHK